MMYLLKMRTLSVKSPVFLTIDAKKFSFSSIEVRPLKRLKMEENTKGTSCILGRTDMALFSTQPIYS